ncbi:jg16173 [Pararge aegeria aegeria]|uniref:Jg16173 protein n=1 Tax=Pararge aegeria aegeria TaxID=348720 RepID=A0A8S4RE83_9NEOP|nr:jg16173 [Pararge aegeria aegeria]
MLKNVGRPPTNVSGIRRTQSTEDARTLQACENYYNGCNEGSPEEQGMLDACHELSLRAQTHAGKTQYVGGFYESKTSR